MQKVLTMLMNTLEIYPYPQFPLTCVVLVNVWLHPQCRRVPSVNIVAIMSEWFHVLTIEESDACKHWNIWYVSLNIFFFTQNKIKKITTNRLLPNCNLWSSGDVGNVDIYQDYCSWGQNKIYENNVAHFKISSKQWIPWIIS